LIKTRKCSERQRTPDRKFCLPVRAAGERPVSSGAGAGETGDPLPGSGGGGEIPGLPRSGAAPGGWAFAGGPMARGGCSTYFGSRWGLQFCTPVPWPLTTFTPLPIWHRIRFDEMIERLYDDSVRTINLWVKKVDEAGWVPYDSKAEGMTCDSFRHTATKRSI